MNGENTTWRPQEAPTPRGLLSSQEQSALSREQRQHLSALAKLFEEDTEEAASEGIALLGEMPFVWQRALPHVVQWHVAFLQKRNQQEEACLLQWRQLLWLDDHDMWLRLGHFVPSWWDRLGVWHPEDAEARMASYLASLAEAIKRTGLAVPALLYADGVVRLPAPSLQELLAQLTLALHDPVWTQRPGDVGPWSGMLSQGWSLLIARAAQADTELLSQEIERCMKLTWERFHRHWRPEQLFGLLKTLAEVDAWGAVGRLLKRTNKAWGASGEWCYWHGLWSHQEGDLVQAKVSFEACLVAAPPSLGDDDWLHLGHMLLRIEALPLAEKVLLLIDDKEREPFSVFAILYCEAVGDEPTALVVLARQVWEDRVFALVFEVGLLMAQSRWEGAHEALVSVLALEQRSRWADTLSVLWGMWHAHQREWGRAVALFEGHWQVMLSQSLHPWWQKKRLAQALAMFGEAFQQQADDSQALSCYLQSLKWSPNEAVLHRCIGLLIKHGQWDDVGALLRSAAGLMPLTPLLRFAHVLWSQHRGDWLEVHDTLQDIGADWFVRQGRFAEWLVRMLEAKVALERWEEAWRLMEVHLGHFVSSPDESPHQASLKELLLALRERVSEVLLRQAASWRAHHKETATSTPVPSRRKEDGASFLRLLSSQDELSHHQEASSALCAGLWQAFPEAEASLSTESRSFLEGAFFLLAQMQTLAHADYSPVVLQFARFVEGECNSLFIDALAQWVLSEGGFLEQLPRVSLGVLLPTHNRLSLGDIARLLYHTIQVQEEDGSHSTVKNPYSNPSHRAYLEAFWESLSLPGCSRQEKMRWKNQLPHQLILLAQLRNKAGHAGTILGQVQAERVSRMLWEPDTQKGLAPFLFSVRRGHVEEVSRNGDIDV